MVEAIAISMEYEIRSILKLRNFLDRTDNLNFLDEFGESRKIFKHFAHE